jgi:transposase
MERAVKRGLARRRLDPVPYLGVDETSFRRRHRYVTVVSDLEKPRVLDVQDHRRRESLDAFWDQWPQEHKEAIVGVAMDMCEPYIQSTLDAVPGAEEKIVFDKFHIAKNLGDAVDKVRRQEHRQLLAEGKPWLKGTKYDWLRHPSQFSDEAWKAFMAKMHRHHTKTARAWNLKEFFMGIYEYFDAGPADVQFQSWYQWARRSRLEPFKKLALTFRKYWRNIRTYFQHNITNAASETINSMIQRVKVMARGFRNPARFRMAILFHCGGLKLYPAQLSTSS